MKKFFAVLLSLVLTVSAFTGFIVYNPVEVNAASGDLMLSANYLALEVDQIRTILAYVTPTQYSDDVDWSSSDTSVAEVSSKGVITAKSVGTAEITATVDELGKVATCFVNVLSGNLSGNFNFSESNMMTNVTYEDNAYPNLLTTDDGGNTSLALSYLARWDGPVFEEDDRFPASTYPSDIVYRELDAEYHLQNAVFIPNRTSYTDNDKIKEAVVKYGAIYATFAVNYDCFDYYSKTYYCPTYIDPVDGGHAVAIVGWDDNYSKSNFIFSPPGNGAFICKNSWGTESGYDGYFYISYYDSSIGNRDIMTAYTGLEKADNYDKIYQYDPYGMSDYIYKNGENTMYASNVFPESGRSLSSDEELSAVSFYTMTTNTSYEIFVVKDYRRTSSFNNMTRVASGKFNDAGYHTVDFDSITVEAGKRFAVIVKLSVPDEECLFLCEAPFEYFSDYARANSNESFFSFDGDDWDDLTDYFTNYNFCIKAFTNTGSGYSGHAMSGIDNANREYESDKIYTVNELASRETPTISPEFVEYVNSVKSDAEYKGSAIPSPITFSASADDTYDCYLPSEFFLGNEDCLTSIKDQGYTSGCWAFTTLASMESCLIRSASNLANFPASHNQKAEIDAIIDATNAELTGLTLNETYKEVNVEDEFKLTATPSPINVRIDGVVWSSSDTNVATVSSQGNVVAKRPGTATITAQSADGSVSSSCTVAVIAREFCVTWIIDGVSYTQYVPEYSPIIPNVTPEKEGYDFIGWTPALPEYMPSHNVTFTAQWGHIEYEVSIRNNPGTTTVKYGDTLVLSAVYEKLPKNTHIEWAVDGSGFDVRVSDDGDTCYLTATDKGSAEVTLKAVKADGSVYQNYSGTSVSDSQTITAKAGFFQKIISFFKDLFGSNRYIVQNIFNSVI